MYTTSDFHKHPVHSFFLWLQASKPVMGIVQDALVAARMFTARDTFLDKVDVMDLVMHLPDFSGVMPQPAILKPRALWTGKQLFSLLLPDLDLRRKSAWHVDMEKDDLDALDSHVVIRRGVLLSGALCKKTLGTSSGGLVHVMARQHGNQRAAEFLSGTQYVMNQWLLHRGFSVGIADMVIDNSSRQQIDAVLARAEAKVGDMMTQLHRGEFTSVPGQTRMGVFEAKVNQVLNAARDEGNMFAKHMSRVFETVRIC